MVTENKQIVKNAPKAHAVGRRKKAVARVWFKRGKGKVTVNGVDVQEYFDTKLTTTNALLAFNLLPVSGQFDVQVNVFGGGKNGQSDAVKLALARAFVSMDETLRPVLKKYSLLSVDSRVKERKKYGQKGARRKFQFVKR